MSLSEYRNPTCLEERKYICTPLSDYAVRSSRLIRPTGAEVNESIIGKYFEREG